MTDTLSADQQPRRSQYRIDVLDHLVHQDFCDWATIGECGCDAGQMLITLIADERREAAEQSVPPGVTEQSEPDDGSSWKNIRVQKRLAEQSVPLDVDGVVAELIGVEGALDAAVKRIRKATNTLGGIARLLPAQPPAQGDAALREALNNIVGLINELRRNGYNGYQGQIGYIEDQALQALAAQPTAGEDHEHDFVNPANEAVQDNGYLVCTICGKLQAPTASMDPDIPDDPLAAELSQPTSAEEE